VASPDTEVVQSIWVSNENRYGVGVIRHGRFIPASSPGPTSPPGSPDPGSDPSSSLGEMASNYGILEDGLKASSQQGYMTNDPGFRPPVHGAPVAPGLSDSPPNSLTNLVVFGVAIALVLLALIILLAKGRRP
jgi:hypothetical protein